MAEIQDILIITLKLILVLFLVLLNGFFVASEFAIVKVRATRIEQLVREGHAKAKTAQLLVKNLDAYLSATQLGITLASLALGWVAEPFLAGLIEPLLRQLHISETITHVISFGIVFSLITFLHIVIGEMAPKSLAIRRSEATTLWIAYPLRVFFIIFKPTIWFLNESANQILKWLKVELAPDHQSAHTEEEIRMLVQHSHHSGIIDQTELSLFDNIFDFSDRVAREIMVPRVDMICIYQNDPFQENLMTIKKSHFTRFPLCGEDKDDVHGIIHIRDVYEQILEGNEPNLKAITRTPVFVPETLEIKDVLRTLQQERTEMAIVVDEYGGISGLITLENIIEEIVGEIQDEFDDEQPFFKLAQEGTLVDAHLLIEEVNDHFQLSIEDTDNDRIGGWFFSQLQTMPEVGSTVSYGSYKFIVHEMNGRSITQLLVKPLDTN
ncbi:HlyC/CorC family transporter [Hazenella sp. IB182357]|uniref:HlyC/CorC family transporter n=1 Tax=Polycladospora coralii TaxID=2771432 RepID=A0A926RSY6_9BACL|nr:hemolysin family protein [Polycladospora coralii]MBD1370963.1 HlyC/CorC family transporter [Polycladospora coralii]MBS7529902.1 HlyC/CorC family transporter [Polycladospora coralii]